MGNSPCESPVLKMKVLREVDLRRAVAHFRHVSQVERMEGRQHHLDWQLYHCFDSRVVVNVSGGRLQLMGSEAVYLLPRHSQLVLRLRPRPFEVTMVVR